MGEGGPMGREREKIESSFSMKRSRWLFFDASDFQFSLSACWFVFAS